jgi:transcriptional regulator with XRE-family HTH domain
MSAGPINRLPSDFGKLLKRLRVKVDLSQEALALAAGFSDINAVENMERGEREPTLTEFFRIANALRDPPAILLTDLIAAWRGDSLNFLYPSRPSDFSRVYRLGYYYDVGDFREHPTTYGSVDQATDAARRLNPARQKKELRAIDMICIYVRLGCLHFDWRPDRD